MSTVRLGLFIVAALAVFCATAFMIGSQEIDVSFHLAPARGVSERRRA